MPPDFIKQLHRRLIERGCPPGQARRLVREVADHREDLKQAFLSEGHSGMEAEGRANARLGDPVQLAEQQMSLLRRSSWWGRHVLSGFCLLPLLVVPVLWGLMLFLGLALEFAVGYGWDGHKLHTAANNPVAFHHMVIAVHCADYAAIAAVTLLFCWLSRRSAAGFKWMMVACGICSLYALFIWIQIRPHNFTLGVSWQLHWIRAIVPLMIAGTIYGSQWRKTRVLQQEIAV